MFIVVYLFAYGHIVLVNLCISLLRTLAREFRVWFAHSLFTSPPLAIPNSVSHRTINFLHRVLCISIVNSTFYTFVPPLSLLSYFGSNRILVSSHHLRASSTLLSLCIVDLAIAKNIKNIYLLLLPCSNSRFFPKETSRKKREEN